MPRTCCQQVQSEDSFHFPRSARLLSAADYSAVFSKSSRQSDRYWTVLVRSDCQGPPRLGLAIAKKRAKRAVDRNRIKRVARESFRCNRRDLHGCELVVMNRDAAAKASSRELRLALDRIIWQLIASTSES